VKTPLSFLYRLLPLMLIAVGAEIYAPVSDDLKRTVAGWTFLGSLGLGAVVLVFAWFKPKNIVYGESGHRAEHKVEYGTRKETINREELDRLPLSSDPTKPKLEWKD
jgi:hypothetical protein